MLYNAFGYQRARWLVTRDRLTKDFLTQGQSNKCSEFPMSLMTKQLRPAWTIGLLGWGLRVDFLHVLGQTQNNASLHHPRQIVWICVDQSRTSAESSIIFAPCRKGCPKGQRTIHSNEQVSRPQHKAFLEKSRNDKKSMGCQNEHYRCTMVYQRSAITIHVVVTLL